ncbi:MAG: hypothetical protein ACKPKO_56215, partial [Candidatus Fonsibacter sp.]
LRRDGYFTRKARNTYNFLFLIPTPEEAGLADFEHPQLVKLEWTEQTHSTGSKVLLPILPGPFGDYKWHMVGKQDISANAKNGLGFTAGSEFLRWFYIDEIFDRMLLNEPCAPYCTAPLRDLYECSEHFYTSYCAEHPGKKPDIIFSTWLSVATQWTPAGRNCVHAFCSQR